MTWLAFKTLVNNLLTVEVNRLGAATFIAQQIRLGIGDIQRVIDYYRQGIVTTLEVDDLERLGFASTGTLPAGISLRELYHVKAGNRMVRRPLRPYDFSNRHDLQAGIVNFGCGSHFFYTLDPRQGRKFMVYPLVTEGYSIQVVWDALVGRAANEYADTDEVPFDEPMADLVHEFVKWKLAREVDRDLALAKDYERTYRQGVARLYAEVQERLRQKVTPSTATCSCPTCGASGCGCASDPNVILYGASAEYPYGYPYGCTLDSSGCPVIALPQSEWVMFGDSGQQEDLNDTIAVATAVKALNPDFIVHLGDSTYPDGAASGLFDHLLCHYWGYIPENFYIAPSNHDLSTDYGVPVISALPAVKALIGDSKLSAHQLWYEFARGPVRFFVLNSGTGDDDALMDMDAQKVWLQAAMAAATEPWLIVAFHRPAYTSDENHYPGSALMQSIPFREWGADLVVSGHSHNYERTMDVTGLLNVVCGLGGAEKRDFVASPVTGSQFRYNTKNGFLSFTADATKLQFALRTVDGEIVDRVTLLKT